MKVIIMKIEKEKMRLGNVGGGLVEGGRASVAGGGLGLVTTDAAMKGGYRSRLRGVRTDHGATCTAERGVRPQGRGRFWRVVGECQYRGEKWKLIGRSENMLGAIQRCRSGERGGVARAGVNLKSSETEWRWEDEDELVAPSGVNSSGEVGSGDGWVELRPPSGAESLSH